MSITKYTSKHADEYEIRERLYIDHHSYATEGYQWFAVWDVRGDLPGYGATGSTKLEAIQNLRKLIAHIAPGLVDELQDEI